jgi:hypothetical protein
MKTTTSLLVLVLAIGLILPAWAESDPAVLRPATSFFTNYNQHDIQGASTLFVEEPSITDAFPPFHWEGKGAFRKWMADLDNFNTANKYTDYDFKPGKPLSQDVEGERANVVIPVVLDLKHDGKPDRFDGLVNVVLEKTNNSWKMERGILVNRLCDIPGLFLAGSRKNEPRPGLPGPKVSFASSRWGTEPEGWYVDLPYAVFIVGVNYSPLECRRSNCGARLVSIEIAGHELHAMATAPGICPLASAANPLFLLVCGRTRPLDL